MIPGTSTDALLSPPALLRRGRAQALDVCIALLDPHPPEPTSPGAGGQDPGGQHPGALPNGGPRWGDAAGRGDAADDFRRAPGRPLQSLQSKAIAGVCKHVPRLSDMLVDAAAPFKQARHFRSSSVIPTLPACQYLPVLHAVPVDWPQISLLFGLHAGGIYSLLETPRRSGCSGGGRAGQDSGA